jgi:tyrosine-protein phosphatase SIW14
MLFQVCNNKIFPSTPPAKCFERTGNNAICSCQMHLGVGVWMPEASWKPISEELIKYALEIVLDVTNHPILVMCS